MKSQVTKTTRQWTAAAAGIALALSAVPHAAQAGAKAYANIGYNNFQFFHIGDLGPGGGDTVLELINDVNIVSFNTTTTNRVDRIAGPGAGGDSNVTSDIDAADGVNVDTPVACVGPGCAGKPVAENDFSMGNFNVDEYVRADSIVAGSGLDLSAAFGAPKGTVINTGSLNTVAESITQAGANDEGRGSFANTSSFTIVPMAGIAIRLDFTAFRNIFTDLHDDAAVGSNASGEVSFTISLQQGNTQIALFGVPNLNVSRASAIPTDPANTFSSVDNVSITTPLLTAGQAYTFQLNFQSNVTLNASKEVQVPEPSALGLIGLGLMGVAMGARRRRKA